MKFGLECTRICGAIFAGTLALSGCVSTATGALGDAAALSMGLQQNSNAFPLATLVPAGEALPIDGVWQLGDLNKRVEMDRGRMVALDPWTFMLTKKVLPGTVLIRDIRETGPGQYQGFDLAWEKPVTFSETGSGRVGVRVQTFPLPVSYELIPTAGSQPYPSTTPPAGGAPVTQPPTPESGDRNLDDCDLVDINPETGQLYCID